MGGSRNIIATRFFRTSFGHRVAHRRAATVWASHCIKRYTGADAQGRPSSAVADKTIKVSGTSRSLKLALASASVLGAGGVVLYVWQDHLGLQIEEVASVTPNVAQPENVSDPVPSGSEAEESALEPSDSDGETQTSEVEPDEVIAPLPPVDDDATLEARQAAKDAAARTLANAEASRLAGIEKRNAARAALVAAVESKNFAELQEAISEAEGANLGNCAELALAQSLTMPSIQLQRAARGATSVSLPKELEGVSTDDVSDVLAATFSNMSEEELKTHIVRLSRFLAAGRLYAKAGLEESLATHLEAAEATGLERLEEALQQLKVTHDAETDARCAALQSSMQEQHVETVTTARAQAAIWIEESLADTAAAMEEKADEIVAGVKSTHLHDVISYTSGLQNVTEVLGIEAARVERVQACNSLAGAVLQLEEAILAGRTCESELQKLCSVATQTDGFVSEVLAALPEDCIALCQEGSVPTEASIMKQVRSKISELTTAAFLPPGGGLSAELVAHVFRSMYITSSSTNAPVFDSGSEAVKENLAAINRLSRVSSPNELEDVLLSLEASLTGSCRERAMDWLTSVRAALVLRQTLWTVKARVQCLTASAAV